ncbi:glycoside hydrolase family 43 protein [Aridibaculum aurantiacum]|uniref:glycoside hydrolase family 43 protein n=1 Tax=Aridibaculum aurantiacum TaxID=2810307 RepID=UPI001A95A868|nr:glycoside hydrolase family 43 protein [Aridibaculum aurantiacum]
MKRWFTILFAVVALSSCGKKVYMFSSFKEPANEGLRFLYSYDGVNWTRIDSTFLKPELDQKVMRDPSIVQGPDGTFHLVFTSAWKGSKTFGYASSKDLINWTEQRALPVMTHEATTVNVWAPELFYDDERDQFIIIWASTIPHRFERGIEEEENNHRMYYVTTKDFKTFSDTKLFLDPGFSVIDCVIVKRGKDDYVLVLKDNTRPERNIKIAFAKDPLGPYTKPSAPFTPNFTEGPAVAKVDDGYIIYYDQYRDKIYGAMKTKDFINFTDVTKEVKVPEAHKHGTIFMTNKKILKGLLKAAAEKK